MKKEVKQTHKLKTIYAKDINNKTIKKTFYIPIEWDVEKEKQAIKIIKTLSPALLQEMTERNILTYCVIEYVNGNRKSHFDIMKRELKKAGL